jgi:heterodisulfide reductase subunit A
MARRPDAQVLKDLAGKLGVTEVRVAVPDDEQSRDGCILCGLCVRVCRDLMGVGAISFTNRGVDREVGTPFGVPSEVCRSCGACEQICPTGAWKLANVIDRPVEPIGNEYQENLASRAPIYSAFAQAVPNVPVIDRESCAHFLTDSCGLCEKVCPAKAIDYSQTGQEEAVEVGSVILAPGFDEFDPKLKPEYGYGVYPNVYTSIEFERLSNASGPYGGHLKRRSDLNAPKRIAFLQCVGSRDASCDRDFCSSVCCMYAVKESVIAKEHAPDLDISIFAMDIRSFGKDFDRFTERAQSEYGINMIRSRIAALEEVPGTHDLRLRYETEDGGIKDEVFDMVVLSVGLDKVEGAEELAKAVGIDLDRFGFCRTTDFGPVETARPGVYVCGAFSGPKDIPETVAQASAAASKVSADLSQVRGTLTVEREYPPEIPILATDEPRIGVFVCHCGINIGSVVDVPDTVEYAKTLPNVAYAEANLYTCSQDTQVAIREKIKEHDLNRVVVASCSPRTHEPLFQETCQQAGLNRYLFEMANIRDQCSWVHMHEPARATHKAKDLIRMAVAKARKLNPLSRMIVDVEQSGLVIGGGPAGMTAALELAAQGFDVTLVEQSPELGGHLHSASALLSGDNPVTGLKRIVDAVTTNEKIEVLTNARVTNVAGYVGNFDIALNAGGEEKKIKRGAIIVATGAGERVPTVHGYGQSDRIMTQRELDQQLAALKVNAKSVVMIQCVNSRDDDHPYCSRVCCSTAVKNALRIKEQSPGTEVHVLYRDMRTYGLRESAYRRAREAGVIFTRFDKDWQPEVTVVDGMPRVRFLEPLLHEMIEIEPDLLVLSAGIAPNAGNPELAKLLKVPVNADGFFLEAHVKLRPSDFATDGIFVCGTAHGPKHVDESITQGCAAASRACTLLSAGQIETEGVVAEVDREKCSKCGICESNCPFAAIAKDPVDGRAKVTEVLCKGCGVCASNCPERAVTVRHFRSPQVLEQVRAALVDVGV